MHNPTISSDGTRIRSRRESPDAQEIFYVGARIPGISEIFKKNAYIFCGISIPFVWSQIHVPQEHMVGLCTFCAADAQQITPDRRERSSYMQMYIIF